MPVRSSAVLPSLMFLCVNSCADAPVQIERFDAAADSPIAALPKVNAVAIADFNADGRLDIAVVNGDPGELLVLLNQGDARFVATIPERTNIGATASGLVAADVNADGRPDLVACFHDRDEVAVLLAKGGGEFDSPAMQRIVNRSQGHPHVHNLALADINGDGFPDIVVAQADDNAITWALGDGAGKFRPSGESFSAGRHPYTITVADFNGDGRPDVASPNFESNDLTVGLNDGAGGFAAPSQERVSLPRRTLMLAAGDVNADGHVDLVCSSDHNQRELALLLGDGRGGFTRSLHAFTAPSRCYGQVVADLNGDGRLDVATPCIDRSSVLVWFAETPATLQFRRAEFLTPGTDSQVLAIADVNGDGMTDITTAGWSRPTVGILLGHRRGPAPE